MKILIIIIFITLNLSFVVSSNETEIIELHVNQSLDQMVLDQENTEIKEKTEITNMPVSENSSESSETEINNNDEGSLDIVNIKSEVMFFDKIEPIQVNKILKNAKNIKSKTLQDEFNNLLINLNFDNENIKDKSIFYSIVNYFYNIGSISKSYSLIKSKNIEDSEKINFYNILEINYLLSTSQLENVCNIKNDLKIETNLKNNFKDKIEIFCLILQGKQSEAELLNSIMLEMEEQTDKTFQQLFYSLSNVTNDETNTQDIFIQNFDKNLIFLYSAMARIAEVPLNEVFLNIDPLNLAIPIILNKSTPINLRLKAANKSYLNGSISIESLAALYQSVDFDSGDLNQPKETINKFSNDIELLMAFHFQLINIQIFPSERLEALIDFWNFAKKNNIESIAFALSNTIVNSIEIKAEYLKYSPQIAMSYISNNNLIKATEWITFYEKVNGVDNTSNLVNMLISFHSSDDINSIVNTINDNYEELIKLNADDSEELFFILSSILLKDKPKILLDNFDKIYDERQTTSIYLTENIQASIDNNEQNKFLIYSIISLNNKEWNEIHPSNLKLLLKGFLKYKNGLLFKDIILEIFKNHQLI